MASSGTMAMPSVSAVARIAACRVSVAASAKPRAPAPPELSHITGVPAWKRLVPEPSTASTLPAASMLRVKPTDRVVKRRARRLGWRAAAGERDRHGRRDRPDAAVGACSQGGVHGHPPGALAYPDRQGVLLHREGAAGVRVDVLGLGAQRGHRYPYAGLPRHRQRGGLGGLLGGLDRGTRARRTGGGRVHLAERRNGGRQQRGLHRDRHKGYPAATHRSSPVDAGDRSTETSIHIEQARTLLGPVCHGNVRSDDSATSDRYFGSWSRLVEPGLPRTTWTTRGGLTTRRRTVRSPMAPCTRGSASAARSRSAASMVGRTRSVARRRPSTCTTHSTSSSAGDRSGTGHPARATLGGWPRRLHISSAM